ncbi:MAG TPA: oxidoreductase [Bacteroidales bacterium]|nr:YhdH/YhfP family quinone oxidoreductase [Lentimicrobiaceae bacterium]HAH59746.1 oxidoreductase [Bacteroidales bacterium]
MSAMYKALVAEENEQGQFFCTIKMLPLSALAENEVEIKVSYSSLNYKDALSASGNRGITRRYPHTPGIDASGVVVSSSVAGFKAGDEVMVSGYDLGMNTFGGFGQRIRVPAEWIIPLPKGLSCIESMMLGTAGFTAGLALTMMKKNGQSPEKGPILVTGAGGGLGSLAIAILAKAGYTVIAASGKHKDRDYFTALGASGIISRDQVDDVSGKMLLRPRWAGAIDTVGGNILATAARACQRHGNVAVCGNASSHELPLTVFPFILNGINLLGIDSATCPMLLRRQVWEKLSDEWKPATLDKIADMITLEELPMNISKILKGEIKGRKVVKIGD